MRSIKDVTWVVEWCNVQPGVKEDVARLADLLADRWEPFAVTSESSTLTYHLRRQFYGS